MVERRPFPPASAGSAPSKLEDTDDACIAQIIDAGARTLCLPIHADWQPALVSYYRVLLQHARYVEAFPLPDETDPAPVFRA